jgi:hypothetical protein
MFCEGVLNPHHVTAYCQGFRASTTYTPTRLPSHTPSRQHSQQRQATSDAMAVNTQANRVISLLACSYISHPFDPQQKCLANIVVYVWNKGKPIQRSKSEISTQLQVRDTETQQQTNIVFKDPAESHKMLSTFQNLTGNPYQQAKALQQKENKLIVFFRHSKLLTYKVSLAYTKSLQFPVGVTMMSYDTLNNISKRTTHTVIGAMHVNRSLPRILTFMGTKLLGLGLWHHYCAQGISHIKQLIQHTRQQDENGKMYRIILDYGQLLAGVHYPILQHPKPKLPHIKDPLITTICQFLSDSQLNIVIPDLYIPKPLRESDQNIMSEILKIEKSPIAIQRVNQCRLFLQITWLSKMTDPQVNTVLPEFLDFTSTHTDVSKSNLKWLIQALVLQNHGKYGKS